MSTNCPEQAYRPDPIAPFPREPQPQPTRSAEAIRQARFRQRAREGLAVLPVEVDEPRVIAMLVRVGVLSIDHAGDRKKVAKALGRYIRAMAC